MPPLCDDVGRLVGLCRQFNNWKGYNTYSILSTFNIIILLDEDEEKRTHCQCKCWDAYDSNSMALVLLKLIDEYLRVLGRFFFTHAHIHTYMHIYIFHFSLLITVHVWQHFNNDDVTNNMLFPVLHGEFYMYRITDIVDNNIIVC